MVLTSAEVLSPLLAADSGISGPGPGSWARRALRGRAGRQPSRGASTCLAAAARPLPARQLFRVEAFLVPAVLASSASYRTRHLPPGQGRGPQRRYRRPARSATARAGAQLTSSLRSAPGRSPGRSPSHGGGLVDPSPATTFSSNSRLARAAIMISSASCRPLSGVGGNALDQVSPGQASPSRRWLWPELVLVSPLTTCRQLLIALSASCRTELRRSCPKQRAGSGRQTDALTQVPTQVQASSDPVPGGVERSRQLT